MSAVPTPERCWLPSTLKSALRIVPPLTVKVFVAADEADRYSPTPAPPPPSFSETETLVAGAGPVERQPPDHDADRARAVVVEREGVAHRGRRRGGAERGHQRKGEQMSHVSFFQVRGRRHDEPVSSATMAK